MTGYYYCDACGELESGLPFFTSGDGASTCGPCTRCEVCQTSLLDDEDFWDESERPRCGRHGPVLDCPDCGAEVCWDMHAPAPDAGDTVGADTRHREGARAPHPRPVRALPDPGPVTAPRPQRVDIVGGLNRFIPSAAVERRVDGAGTLYEVRVPGHRVVRHHVGWGECEAAALQHILDLIMQARLAP